MAVSVVSAMARLDIDPWQEAARLSSLSKDVAVLAVGQLIGRLPGGRWKRSEIGSMAARLVDLLPRRGGRARPGRAGPDGASKARLTPVLWLACLALGAVILFGVMRDQGAPSDDGGSAPVASGFVSPPMAGQ